MSPEIFLRGMLRNYYASAEVDTVPEIGSREFGIGEFGRKISSRHLSFRSPKDLNAFLRERAPFYISYSCARYELPSARDGMEKKKMLGADLIYEFDADDIKTECKERHDSWKCANPSCGAEGKGNVKECQKCGTGTKVDEWTCPECIGETKKQTMRLLNFLVGDFGFSEGISINFSGSKGFHTHVRSKAVQGLSKAARLELLDYLTGANLDFRAMGFDFSRKTLLDCPKLGETRGWPKKIMEGVISVFEANDPERLSVLGGSVTLTQAGKLLKEKQAIINGMGKGLLLSFGVKAEKFWLPALQNSAESQKLALDRQTSVDINKIIRVPNTIHGSTGLLARRLDGISAIGAFDALKESVVLPENEIAVLGATAPEFRLNGRKFGPFKNDGVSLPSYAAFYLLARGSAELPSGA